MPETVPLLYHLEALRQADQRAIEIGVAAEREARELARAGQTYRDEQANRLREQINCERGLYATKDELKPIVEFVASQRGRSTGLTSSWSILIGVVGLAGTIIGIAGSIAAVVIFFTK